MWWAVGGILVVATVRWISGRNRVPSRGDRVELAYETLRRGRPVAIASAAAGTVVIRGRVSAAGVPLTAPVSGRPCVFYEVPLADLRRVPSGSVRRGRTFLVSDETGTAEVAFEDVGEVSFLVVEPGHIAVSEAAIFVGETVTVAGVGAHEVAPAAESAGYRQPPTRYVVRAGADVVLMVRREQ